MRITTKKHHRAYDRSMFPQKSMYSRTQNENGSYNSRCLDCFMTIASCVETEEELEQREASHICPEKALANLLAARRAAISHVAHN
ncbi:MAG: hypothetical protein ABSD70_15940 [Terracidiphilus sp.]|jgi:hypothetical protein